MDVRVVGLLSALTVLSGCTNPAPPNVLTKVPENPSPLPHLTYDCNVLASAPGSGSQPVFYLEPFDDGGSGQTRMCVLDWDGKLRQEIPRGLATRQSADGDRLLAVDYPIVDSSAAKYVIVDGENHLLDRVASIWRDEAIWADDSRHLCYVEDSNSSGRGGVAYLTERLPGGPSRRAATLGYITFIPPQALAGGRAPSPFVAGPHILACSVLTDRAIVLNPETGVLTVFRLSDGAALRTHSFGHQFYPYGKDTPAEHLVASQDGRYVADNIERASSVPVLDVLADRVVARVPAIMLAGFAWDGSRAVVRLNDHVIEVIDWQSGRVFRQLAGTYASARARPDTLDLLIGLPSTRHQFGLDLYIVRGDGSAFEVARSVEFIDQ